MAYKNLKTSVQNSIYQNSNKSITGNVMQNVLLAIISTMGDNSMFMGILTDSNKPTAVPDGKQFYIGYNNSTTPLSVDLTAVALGTLTITQTNIYLVYSNGGAWSAVDIASGIGGIVTDNSNSIDTIEGNVTSIQSNYDADMAALYQTCGIGLYAYQDFDADFPNVATNGRVFIDGVVASIVNEHLTIGHDKWMWFMPHDNYSQYGTSMADVWTDIAKTNNFGIFIPSGNVIQDYIVNQAWPVVGLEHFGLDPNGEWMLTYDSAHTRVMCYNAYYQFYHTALDGRVSFKLEGRADRADIMSHMA